MSALIFINAEKLSALIFLLHEKWVGLNILCESALIFLALRTGPFFCYIITLLGLVRLGSVILLFVNFLRVKIILKIVYARQICWQKRSYIYLLTCKKIKLWSPFYGSASKMRDNCSKQFLHNFSNVLGRVLTPPDRRNRLSDIFRFSDLPERSTDNGWLGRNRDRDHL